jgi:phosphatidylinositol phospholipase C, beta
MSLPMLFCNIELKIYVPDGFEDFMAALSDPVNSRSIQFNLHYLNLLNFLHKQRAFMGAAKERSDNMKAMGIEEASGGGAASAQAEKKEEKKEEPLVFEPITIDSLRQEKGFVKTARKQQKEIEGIRKKHGKERMALQKTQNGSIERLIKGKSKDEIKNDASIRKVIQEQNQQWSEMVERHKKEEWEMIKQQITDQQEILRSFELLIFF